MTSTSGLEYALFFGLRDNIAVDGRRHQEVLTGWADRDAWDWGEERRESEN